MMDGFGCCSYHSFIFSWVVATMILMSRIIPSQTLDLPTGYVQLDAVMRNVTRYEGETIRIRCEITGFPLPGYRWFHDGQIVTSQSDTSAPMNGAVGGVGGGPLTGSGIAGGGATVPGRLDSKTTPWGSRLKIDNLNVNDSGLYMCEGYNAYGHQVTAGYLHVHPGPNPNPSSRPASPDQFHHKADLDDHDHGLENLTDEEEELIREEDDDDDESSIRSASSPAAAGPRVPGSVGKEDSVDASRKTADKSTMTSSCHVYGGKVCASVLSNKRVYLPTIAYLNDHEAKIIGTLLMISDTIDLSDQCVSVARSLLCHYAFRPCETATSGSENSHQLAANQPPLCRRNCDELDSDTCRRSLELVKRHLEKEYVSLPPRCDRIIETSETCDVITYAELNANPTGNRGVNLTSENATTTTVAYGIASCAGIVLALTVSVLVARRCQRRYHPVVSRHPSHSKLAKAPTNQSKQPFHAVHQQHHVQHLQQHQQSSYSGKSEHHLDRQMQEQTAMLLPGGPSRVGFGPPASSSLTPASTRLTEIHPSSVRIVQLVGNGSFGAVYVGEVILSSPITVDLDSRQSSAVCRPVIVKTCSASTGSGGLLLDHQLRAYFAERTYTASELRHVNLLNVVGACLQSAAAGSSGTMSALYEHIDGIDMHSFLRRRGCAGTPESTSMTTLLSLAEDVAAGLEYAASRGWIHGDVAGHNVLVIGARSGGSSATSSPRAKICDLGIKSPWCSVAGQSPSGLSSLPPAPCCQGLTVHQSTAMSAVTSGSSSFSTDRLVAPEVLVYGPLASGEPSDVWSYGVLLWELFSVRTALEAVFDDDDEDTKTKVCDPATCRSLQAPFDNDMLFVWPGALPIRCPPPIAAILSECWIESPGQRPTFSAIRSAIASMLEAIAAPVVSTLARRGIGIQASGNGQSQQPPTDINRVHGGQLTPTQANIDDKNSPATSNDTACTTLTAITPMMTSWSQQYPHQYQHHQQQLQQQPQWTSVSFMQDSKAGFQRGPVYYANQQVPDGAACYWSSSDNSSSLGGDTQRQQLRQCQTPSSTFDRALSYRCQSYSNVV